MNQRNNPGNRRALLVRALTIIICILNVNCALAQTQEALLQFATTTARVGEAGRLAIVRVVRSGDIKREAIVRVHTSDLTASTNSPADYMGVSTNLIFGSNETRKIVAISILDDGLAEGTEQFMVTLTEPGVGVSIGSRSNLVFSITDNDRGGVIQFARREFEAHENNGTAEITVTRVGGAASNVTVRLATETGTVNPANDPSDYTSIETTLTFGAGQTKQVIMIPLADDMALDGNKTVALTLRDPLGGARLAVSNALLRILDDESSVTLEKSSYAITESSAPIILKVVRSGALFTTARVDLVTFDLPEDNAASTGLDYVGTNISIIFPPRVSVRYAKVRILPDSLDEANEVFGVQLANAQGTLLGTITNAIVTIVDNDSGGHVQFTSANFTVSEAARQAAITLRRTDGTASGVTVQVNSIGGSASEGSDYLQVSTNVVFGAGETSKRIFVPLLSDDAVEDPLNVSLLLSDPTGGAVVGAQATTVLTILNDYSASGYAPDSSVRGKTFRLRITGGTGAFARSGSSLFVTSPTTDTYQLVPLTGNIAPSSGTYSYDKVAPNVGFLDVYDSSVGESFSVTVTFYSPKSGRYNITAPGLGTQQATFTLSN